jgi:hypothetical protein
LRRLAVVIGVIALAVVVALAMTSREQRGAAVTRMRFGSELRFAGRYFAALSRADSAFADSISTSESARADARRFMDNGLALSLRQAQPRWSGRTGSDSVMLTFTLADRFYEDATRPLEVQLRLLRAPSGGFRVVSLLVAPD